MAKIYPKQLILSGSDIQAGIPTIGGYNNSSLNPTMSISDALNTIAVSGSERIGQPTDGFYSDGFFNKWTKDTRISDAFDDINELLIFITPDKPDTLTGQDLVVNSPGMFTGYLSAELDSGSWYVGVSSGDRLTTLISGSSITVEIDSPDTSTRFYADRSASYAELVGGVSASRAFGSESLYTVNSRSFSDGEGSSGIIQISDISTYNNIWLKANARITDVISRTGSIKYKIDGGKNGGNSNVHQFFNVGDGNDFPDQAFSISPYTSSLTPSWKYMSGLKYYGKGTTLNINYRAINLYNPIYYSNGGNETQITSSYFSNIAIGTSSLGVPVYWWDYPVTQSRTLSDNVKTLYNNLGTFTVRLVKPGKNDVVSDAVNIGNRPINTYLTRSTNLIEYFDDEAYRWYGIDSASWDSTQLLTNGMLQVNNGRLIHAGFGGYSIGAFPVSSEQFYYRPFYSVNPNENGTITILRNGFSGLPNIVGKWGGSSILQMAFVIASESGSFIYDLGRSIGDNSGNIYGIRNGAINGNTITWSLPSGKQVTNSDPLVLMVRTINVTSNDYLTQIIITYDNG